MDTDPAVGNTDLVNGKFSQTSLDDLNRRNVYTYKVRETPWVTSVRVGLLTFGVLDIICPVPTCRSDSGSDHFISASPECVRRRTESFFFRPRSTAHDARWLHMSYHSHSGPLARNQCHKSLTRPIWQSGSGIHSTFRLSTLTLISSRGREAAARFFRGLRSGGGNGDGTRTCVGLLS